MLPEPKILLSVVSDGSCVVMGSVESVVGDGSCVVMVMVVVIGGCVVGTFLTLKLLD